MAELSDILHALRAQSRVPDMHAFLTAWYEATEKIAALDPESEDYVATVCSELAHGLVEQDLCTADWLQSKTPQKQQQIRAYYNAVLDGILEDHQWSESLRGSEVLEQMSERRHQRWSALQLAHGGLRWTQDIPTIILTAYDVLARKYLSPAPETLDQSETKVRDWYERYGSKQGPGAGMLTALFSQPDKLFAKAVLDACGDTLLVVESSMLKALPRFGIDWNGAIKMIIDEIIPKQGLDPTATLRKQRGYSHMLRNGMLSYRQTNERNLNARRFLNEVLQETPGLLDKIKALEAQYGVDFHIGGPP